MSTTIEDQLRRYGQHLAELEALGQLVPDGSPPPAGPRRGAVVLVAVLALFVAAVVGMALRAGTSTSSPPATEVPPPTTEVDPSEGVPLLTLPDEGGTSCFEGVCMKLSRPHPDMAGSRETQWLVGLVVDGNELGSQGWTPCAAWQGLALGAGTTSTVLGGLLPPRTPVLSVPGLSLRQVRVSAGGDVFHVVAATFDGLEVQAAAPQLSEAVRPYFPDPEATPQSCRDQWERQREEMERLAGESPPTVEARGVVTTLHGWPAH
jgi:hypothetical protein